MHESDVQPYNPTPNVTFCQSCRILTIEVAHSFNAHIHLNCVYHICIGCTRAHVHVSKGLATAKSFETSAVFFFKGI